MRGDEVGFREKGLRFFFVDIPDVGLLLQSSSSTDDDVCGKVLLTWYSSMLYFLLFEGSCL